MSAAVLRKNAVRRPAIRSRESPVDACKTAAQAEMLQTHTGGDNPVVCVAALHRQPEHAAADVSNVRHARASTFLGNVGIRHACKPTCCVAVAHADAAAAKSRGMATNIISRRGKLGELQSVREDGGLESPRAKRTTQECEAS